MTVQSGSGGGPTRQARLDPLAECFEQCAADAFIWRTTLRSTAAALIRCRHSVTQSAATATAMRRMTPISRRRRIRRVSDRGTRVRATRRHEPISGADVRRCVVRIEEPSDRLALMALQPHHAGVLDDPDRNGYLCCDPLSRRSVGVHIAQHGGGVAACVRDDGSEPRPSTSFPARCARLSSPMPTAPLGDAVGTTQRRDRRHRGDDRCSPAARPSARQAATARRTDDDRRGVHRDEDSQEDGQRAPTGVSGALSPQRVRPLLQVPSHPIATTLGPRRKFRRTEPRLVGTARFELATPCSQSRCATRLRHVP
jgi:hypothetical protein